MAFHSTLVLNASVSKIHWATRSILLWTLALSCSALSCNGGEPKHPAPTPHTAMLGSAVSDHPEATRVALDVLSAGGNAADAAAAAALVLGVVSPGGSGIGGGGFALVYKNGKTHVIDFRETAPASMREEELFRERGPRRGASVGVFGEPAGLEFIVKTFGKKTLATVAQPAVLLARNGFVVSHHLAGLAERFGERLDSTGELSKALKGAHGGEKISRPQLADTLEKYGREGATLFYRGEVATKTRTTLAAHSTVWTEEDLQKYAPKERIPWTSTIGQFSIVTMPSPSAGGLMLTEVLSMFSKNEEMRRSGLSSSFYTHMLGEAMRGAISDRFSYVGESADEKAKSFDALSTQERLLERARQIDPNKTATANAFMTREGGTSHLIVIDNENTIVSLTTTVNSPFGSGIEVLGTGVLLNDEMDDFSSSADIATLGILRNPNRAMPGSRPVSSMAPTIVFENGVPVLAVGGSGGPRIATGVTQVAYCILFLNKDAQTCVKTPRFHVALGGKMSLEPGFEDAVRNELVARGESLSQDSGAPSSVHAIHIESGHWVSAADPRKGGAGATK